MKNDINRMRMGTSPIKCWIDGALSITNPATDSVASPFVRLIPLVASEVGEQKECDKRPVKNSYNEVPYSDEAKPRIAVWLLIDNRSHLLYLDYVAGNGVHENFHLLTIFLCV